MAKASSSRGQAVKRTLIGLWRKLNEDWVPNLSGMLAYNYLTATAPLALVAVAIAGLALDTIAPATLDSYVRGLASHIPAGGEQLVRGALTSLSHSASALLIIAIVAAIFGGSRLFIALENCFSVIYRLRDRDLLPQNLVAVGMTLLYAILAPLAFIATGQLSGLLSFISPINTATGGVLSYLGDLAGGALIAFVLFFAMYLFVPSRAGSWRRGWRVAWRGALAAALLLTLYEQLFPLYQRLFLGNAGYGSVAGLAIVAIVFLYYIGFITLLGAEINAWAGGLRPLGVTLPDLYRERDQARDQAR